MTSKKENQKSTSQASILADQTQPAERGNTVGVYKASVEGINLPGERLPGKQLRVIASPDAMPKLIAGLRKMKGMTQKELSEAMETTPQLIGNIEQGQRKLGLNTLIKLFEALGGELYIEFRQK